MVEYSFNFILTCAFTCHGHQLRHVFLPEGTLGGTNPASDDGVLRVEHQMLFAMECVDGPRVLRVAAFFG